MKDEDPQHFIDLHESEWTKPDKPEPFWGYSAQPMLIMALMAFPIFYIVQWCVMSSVAAFGLWPGIAIGMAAASPVLFIAPRVATTLADLLDYLHQLLRRR